MIESLNFSGNQFNFQKYTTRTIDSLRTPYDFRSMMHYGSTAFGGGRMTIQTINSRNQKLLGQRGGFSSIDIQQINKMYCCKLNSWEILILRIKEKSEAFLGLSQTSVRMNGP